MKFYYCMGKLLEMTAGVVIKEMVGFALTSVCSQLANSQLIMIAIDGYVNASYGMIIHSASVKSVPTDFFDAAKVDGANDLQIVRYVILLASCSRLSNAWIMGNDATLKRPNEKQKSG